MNTEDYMKMLRTAASIGMYAKRYERVKSEDDFAFQEARLPMKERYDFNLTI